MKAKKPTTKKNRLTARENDFIDQYIILNDGTKAAIAAKYSHKTARSAACRLLTNVYIREEIDKRRRKLAEKTEITQEKIIRELALLAFSNIDHYKIDKEGKLVLADGAPEGAMRAVSSVKTRIEYSIRNGGGKSKDTVKKPKSIYVEFKLWDKPGPLKLLGEHVGMFLKKMELTGKDGTPIQVETENGLSQEALDAIEARILGREVK